MSIQVMWKNDFEFNVTKANGHGFHIDAEGEKALCPTEVLLSALGSCSATDVVNSLQENGVIIEHLTNDISYTLTDEEPRLYKTANLHFTVKGSEVTEQKIKTAIEEALDKYCHVCLMLKPAIDISYSFDLV